MDFEYWHWLVVGMVLIGVEIFLPSFTVLWFGLGALLVAGAVVLWPTLALSYQLIIWAVLSTGFAIVWFKVLRTKYAVGEGEIAGEIGMVIKQPSEGVLGKVRFTTSLLGRDEWSFMCDEPVTTGDKVRASSVSGNNLRVSKIQ